MIYIVIPVFNRLAFTVECLKSLKNQDYKNYKVIVCNDGSTDETEVILTRDFPWVTLLKGDGNLWWSGAMNLGVRHALEIAKPDDFILSLNNDLTVSPDYLNNLITCASQNPNALIGSVSIEQNSHRILDGGVLFSPYFAKYKRINAGKTITDIDSLNDNKLIKVDLLSGRGVLIPVRVFHKIGIYNSDQLPHYFGDYEFSHRALNAGFSLFCSYKAVVTSYPNSTGLGETNYHSFYAYLTSRRSTAGMQARFRFAWLIRRNIFQFCVFLVLDTLRSLIHFFRLRIRQTYMLRSVLQALLITTGCNASSTYL